MPNTQDYKEPAKQNILVVGLTGSGKTTLIRSLPGRKFVYVFDPNALASLQGADLDYELFLPDALEIDATLKGFNKGSRSDTSPGSRIEPTTYTRWVEDLNTRVEEGFFKDYDWLCIDSLTFLQKTVMDRCLFINNRYGKVEELSDYRIVGSKISDVFRPISGMDINLYITGHIKEFQNETTMKISTELMLAGSAKLNIPMVMSNIWLARAASTEKELKFEIQTRPESRGLQTIRSSLQGLKAVEDVTIKDFTQAEKYGLGALLATQGD